MRYTFVLASFLAIFSFASAQELLPECEDTDSGRAKRIYESASPREPISSADFSGLGGLRLSGKTSELAMAKVILPAKASAIVISRIRETCPGGALLCALTEAFGNDISAYYALASGHRSGYVPSLNSGASGAEYTWNPEEAERIYSAASKFPGKLKAPGYFPIRKSLDMNYDCGRAEASGCLSPEDGLNYSAIFVKERSGTLPVVLHEIGHYVDSVRKGRASYQRLYDSQRCFATQYAGLGGIGETYAEHFAELLVDPGNLAHACAAHYDFFARLAGEPKPYLKWSDEKARSSGTRILEPLTARCLQLVTDVSETHFRFSGEFGENRYYLSRGNIFNLARACGVDAAAKSFAAEMGEGRCSYSADRNEFRENLVNELFVSIVLARSRK